MIASVFACFRFDYWLSCTRPQNAMMQPLSDTSEPGPQLQSNGSSGKSGCHSLIV